MSAIETANKAHKSILQARIKIDEALKLLKEVEEIVKDDTDLSLIGRQLNARSLNEIQTMIRVGVQPLVLKEEYRWADFSAARKQSLKIFNNLKK